MFFNTLLNFDERICSLYDTFNMTAFEAIVKDIHVRQMALLRYTRKLEHDEGPE